MKQSQCTKNIFSHTNVAENAQRNPKNSNSNSFKQTNMTPEMRGTREKYILKEYEIENTNLYESTVTRGDNALIVCTKLTGIREMAIEDKMCETNWKNANMDICFNAYEEGVNINLCPVNLKRQKRETSPNWIQVNVTGNLYSFRICFPKLFVNEEERYQPRHRNIKKNVSLNMV